MRGAEIEARAFTEPVGSNSRRRVWAFVMFLRYTGLGVRDVIRLRWPKDTRSVGAGEWRVFLYTRKTSEPVYVPLAEDMAEAIEGDLDATRQIGWHYCAAKATSTCPITFSGQVTEI